MQKKKITIHTTKALQEDATFVITDEDHTLGNTLHFVLSHNPNVDFSGYSIPHPSENKMNLRVQGKQNHKAIDLLKDSLNQLTDISQTIENNFLKKSQKFLKKNNDSKKKKVNLGQMAQKVLFHQFVKNKKEITDLQN
ncbi:DNA-directed RNA polymerases i and iii subunit rpac2 [Anaeramoeba ignava]|uniref:DNA-directed RNA polymerases i and iii subunit rpac2 n=1 Tax=Anaeramoeba ignava TaxID=1746090 RepID=A0A9Q0LWX5_ANAIG|nr:DNA-directed RNA polymerases i and iii subunit rpac2 [Anaeramoeba ignava]